MEIISNIWKHPVTTITGVLIAIITICGVLSQHGVTLGNAGTGTVVSLIGALATALLGMFAGDGQKSSDSGTASAIGKTLSMLLFAGMLSGVTLTAHAQSTSTSTASGISFTASSAAIYIGGQGNKYVATDLTEALDFKDSLADANGYKNRGSIIGEEIVAGSTLGYNYFGAGGRIEPKKSLAAFLKSVAPNIPADSISFYADGTVGNSIPASGSSLFSAHAGGGLKIALSSGGAVTWNAYQVKWFRLGSKNYLTMSSGIAAVWGN